MVESFETKLMSLLVEHQAVFGPEVDPVSGELCRCGADPCPCRVPEGYQPTNFVLVTNWTDFNMEGEAGEDWMDTTVNVGMRRSQIVGLLMMATDAARQISIGSCR